MPGKTQSPIKLWRAAEGLRQEDVLVLIAGDRGVSVRQPQLSAWENGAGMSRANRLMFERISAGEVTSASILRFAELVKRRRRRRRLNRAA